MGVVLETDKISHVRIALVVRKHSWMNLTQVKCRIYSRNTQGASACVIDSSNDVRGEINSDLAIDAERAAASSFPLPKKLQ